MCKVISLCSHKGGVSKTTSSLNLATALGMMGKRVLVVDMDSQSNLTICAGVTTPDQLSHTTYTLLALALDEGELPPTSEYIIPRNYFDLIPCNINLSAFEVNRGHEIGAERALQTILEPLKASYDFALIDTAPSLGMLTINAITASDSVLVPTTPQLLSAVGVKLLVTTIAKIQKHINPNVQIEGIFMTQCDTRTNLYREMSDVIEKTYGGTTRIFNAIIPHSTKVGEANLRCQSVLQYDEQSKPAQAYRYQSP